MKRIVEVAQRARGKCECRAVQCDTRWSRGTPATLARFNIHHLPVEQGDCWKSTQADDTGKRANSLDELGVG